MLRKSIFLFAMVLSLLIHSQDIHFSQFNFAKMAINPAMTGIHADLAVTLQYRNQWNSISAPFTTYAFSTELALIKEKKNGQ